MMAALKSEFTKTFTTRLWWILALCMAGYVGLMALLMVGILHFAPNDDPHMQAFFGPEQQATLGYSMALLLGYIFPALVGGMTVTQEFRHQTLTPTFLVEPRRGLVLSAKMMAAVPMGLTFALIGVLSAGLGSSVFLAIVGQPTGLERAATWELISRTLVAMTLWAVVGVGLGALIKNQVAVIVVVLATSQLVEPTLRMLPSLTGRNMPVLDFLPSAAADSITGQSIFNSMMSGTDIPGLSAGLPAWAGVLVLLAWGLVPAAIGHMTTMSRDVT